MLNDGQTGNFKAQAHDLFEARAAVDSLIEIYVSRLVSNREELSAHAAVLEAILDSIGDAIAVFDTNGKILLVNSAAVKIIGSNPSSLNRSEVFSQYKIFHEDEITPVVEGETPYDIAMREGHTVRAENLVFGPNLPPEGIWVRISNSPIRNKNGEIIGSVLSFADITERKRLERQRNALATLITHDIKNHLAAQDITFAMLSSDFGANLDDSFRTLLSDLKAQNQKYLDIADTLLELYRSDLQQMESCRVAISIPEILKAAAEMNAKQAKAAGINIVVNTAQDIPAILGIPAALRQSFHNLIQNSIEVSQPGTTITVNAATATSYLLVTVTDQGPGMSPEQVSVLFDRRRVAGDIPTSQKSTGFGLYLARLIVEAHGGSLTCQSTLGEGTTFTIELPIPRK
jgi:PAS domain S-box-containing protein